LAGEPNETPGAEKTLGGMAQRECADGLTAFSFEEIDQVR
jgi:hypothetical protein